MKLGLSYEGKKIHRGLSTTGNLWVS